MPALSLVSSFSVAIYFFKFIATFDNPSKSYSFLSNEKRFHCSTMHSSHRVWLRSLSNDFTPLMPNKDATSANGQALLTGERGFSNKNKEPVP